MPAEAIEHFIARWRTNEGGAERANFPLFLTELCALLDLPPPDPAHGTHERNDYVFERAVTFHHPDGTTRPGRIDLYRRGCFVLEAKQSRERGGAKHEAQTADRVGEQPGLPGIPAAPRGRRSAHRGWDVLMRNARVQAENYARALPASHGWPPFILTVDVGQAIELFADFSGQGKDYRQFPDRGGYRIYLDDLRDAGVRARLRSVWLDPQSLDPAKHAARVTRDIARRLASVGRLLEARGYGAEAVAHFLMRCLFTMFAEDARLLDHGSFTALLDHARSEPETFAPLLEDLWRAMDTGGVSVAMRGRVRHFNGGLFADCAAIPLLAEEIGELHAAAQYVWTEVEPAIFGTLLEQALDPVERRRLGAHYTPRAYVERLVVATIIAPLRDEWETVVLGTVERERAADPAAAIRAVQDFHARLADTRVLDPACGTGNFLYVALELMKRLEGEVLEVLADLGGQEALEMETVTVHPRHFLGLELNPRAAAIAELVLWLGYLQWQLRNRGTVADPVLEKLDNIVATDAVLHHDGPDDNGRLRHPRAPDWPAADYIVGNPPFIGGKDLRRRLGDDYAIALWKAHPGIPRSADFVMYWWDRAAARLIEPQARLRRFGFVTTNSITQEFSRRVIAKRLDGQTPVNLAMVIADHPWTKATRDAASVRIAMTVAESGTTGDAGTLLSVTSEAGLDSDSPAIMFGTAAGQINAGLTIGADVTGARGLRANAGLCSPGVKLHGGGFVISRAEALLLGLGVREGLERHIRPYCHGRDLTARSRGVMVIDLLGLEEEEVRRRYPEVYQHLLRTVKPDRAVNSRSSYRDRWWLFGEPRRELRAALAGLRRYIATVETAKYRIFQFLDAAILSDNMIICIASDDAVHLGVLSSRISLAWSTAKGGTLEDRPRYTKSVCFDPFPFPDADAAQAAAIGALAEELDAQRKAVLAQAPELTLTGLYNLLAAIRAGDPLTPAQEEQRQHGRVDLLGELHARIDAAVADAYGWSAETTDAAIVARLVALNAERQAEERGGKVRWLRPAYQLARRDVTVLPATRVEQIEADWSVAAAKPSFPRDAIGQTAAVLEALRGGGALSAAAIARRHAQGLRIERRVAATLEALVRLGHVARGVEGYRLRRAA
jgi:hypothetical protein